MQQINLYLPEYRQKRDWFAAEYCAGLLVLLVITLIVLQTSRGAALDHMEEQVVVLETQQKALKEQVEALKQKPAAGKSAVLEQEIAQTREAIRNRESIANFMSGQSLGNQQGFSRQMIALGQHKVDGVALQSFAFAQGGVFARLEGLSQKPELVPLYVAQLQSDENFLATKFGVLSLHNSDTGIRFLLSGDSPLEPDT